MISKHWRGFALAILGIAALAIAACAGNSPINVDGGGPPPSPTPVSLRNAVIPVFQSKGCASSGACHKGGGGSVGGNLTLGDATISADTIYTSLTTPALDGMIVVNTTNVTASEILTKPDSGSAGVTHTGGKLWDSSAAEYKKVQSWISEGALNN